MKHRLASGYVVLSIAIERITGQAFADFLQREMFRPLGMTRTYVVTRARQSTGSFAHGYALRNGIWHEEGYDAYTTGSGGVFSTAHDLVRWGRALDALKIVSGDSLRIASTAEKLESGRPTQYGMGWLAEFEAKGPLANVWYTAAFGDFKGYQGMMKRIPDKQLMIVVLTNRGEFPWKLLQSVHELYAHGP